MSAAESPNLLLPYIMAAQAQKHVTHNDAIRRLDALVQLTVADRDLAMPPPAPVDGARYIVAPGAGGAWSGAVAKIAAYQDGAWVFYNAHEGWLAWVADEHALVVFDGVAWTPAPGGSVNPVPLVGVNATADATNRLSVSSAAALFNHEGGGHQLKINKNAAADTASLLFQTAFSGRSEFGLAGDDDFRIKVSADGGSWKDAVVINRASGEVRHPYGAGQSQIDIISASGTWSKPVWASWVTITAIGAGAGGGSGRRGALATGRGGGGGGGAGGIVVLQFAAADLPPTLDVIIGAAGLGAAAITADDNNGTGGGAGGATTVSAAGVTLLSTLTANGGGAGILSGGGAGGAGGYTNFARANTGGAGGNAGAGAASAIGCSFGPGAGGGGSGISAANVIGAAGAGSVGSLVGSPAVAGVAGAGGGAAGGAGADKAQPRSTGAGGGGGVAGSPAGATLPGGPGGNGGTPGGGGGGGGGSSNGVNSGAGGAGGRGECWLVSSS